jgi:nitric oxide reductase subunit B
MVGISLLPVGFLQLEVAFTEGYAAARSLAFYNRPLIQWLFWARLPGDPMIILSTIIFAYDVIRKRLVLRKTTEEHPTPGSIPDRIATEDDD